jgi:hypothetical protein
MRWVDRAKRHFVCICKNNNDAKPISLQKLTLVLPTPYATTAIHDIQNSLRLRY